MLAGEGWCHAASTGLQEAPTLQTRDERACTNAGSRGCNRTRAPRRGTLTCFAGGAASRTARWAARSKPSAKTTQAGRGGGGTPAPGGLPC